MNLKNVSLESLIKKMHNAMCSLKVHVLTLISEKNYQAKNYVTIKCKSWKHQEWYLFLKFSGLFLLFKSWSNIMCQ